MEESGGNYRLYILSSLSSSSSSSSCLHSVSTTTSKLCPSWCGGSVGGVGGWKSGERLSGNSGKRRILSFGLGSKIYCRCAVDGSGSGGGRGGRGGEDKFFMT